MKTKACTFGQLSDDKMNAWIEKRESEGFVFSTATGSNGYVTVFMVQDEWMETSATVDQETELEAQVDV